jgi:hypothetical protein
LVFGFRPLLGSRSAVSSKSAATRCEIDHIIDHAAGGPTRVDHAVLACRYHNNDAKKQGWQSTLINGRAAWIPPPWIDPDQTPRYNNLHRTDLPE